MEACFHFKIYNNNYLVFTFIFCFTEIKDLNGMRFDHFFLGLGFDLFWTQTFIIKFFCFVLEMVA